MPYPLPVFHFKVTCDQFTGEMGFSEITGLTQEVQPIEYRHGAMPEQHSIKMPGLRKFNNLVMKRGIIKGNGDFFNWLKTVKGNTIIRPETMIISLCDEEDNPVMQWKAFRPFPIKIEGPQLKASGNEVAIESIELACERVELEVA
jgi:phage tail-like protein